MLRKKYPDKFNLGKVFTKGDEGDSIVVKRNNQAVAAFNLKDLDCPLETSLEYLVEDSEDLILETMGEDPLDTKSIYLNNLYLGEAWVKHTAKTVEPAECDSYNHPDESVDNFGKAQLFHFACANLANQLGYRFCYEDRFDIAPPGKEYIIFPFEGKYGARLAIQGDWGGRVKKIPVITGDERKEDKKKSPAKKNPESVQIIATVKEKTEQATETVKKHPVKSLFIFVLALAILAHILKKDKRKETKLVDKLKALFNDLQDRAEEWKEQALNGETFRLFNEMIGKSRVEEKEE